MFFSIFLLAFLAAGAYFMSIQGLTSAVIMLVLTVLCVGISFGTYEYVAQAVLMSPVPDYAYPLAFIGMFIIPLGILRLATDMGIPRCSLFPEILDRAGAAVGAVISSFLITGMLGLAIQMVPWGSGFLGFSRFDPERPEEVQELWLKPDRRVASVGAGLSRGIFSGHRRFTQDHPDIVKELAWAQAEARDVRLGVPANAIRLVETSRAEFVYDVIKPRRRSRGRREQTEEPTRYESRAASPGLVFSRAILEVNANAANEEGKHRFVLRSVRLVGTERDEQKTYHAIAIADNEDEPLHRHVAGVQEGTQPRVDVASMLLMPAGSSGKQIDVVFEHPAAFSPEFVAYKLGGRAKWKPIRSAAAGADSGDRTVASGSRSESRSRSVSPPRRGERTPSPSPTPRRSGGRVSGVRVDFGLPHFGDELPLTMTSYRGRDADIESKALVQGHLFGYLDDQGRTSGRNPVSGLVIPRGKALLHLTVKSLNPRNVLGKSLNFAVQTVENYILTDDQGKTHKHVGKYAIAKVGGEDYVEILYFPDYAETGGRFGTFTKIKRQHLKGDYQLVYLFLLDKGVQAVEFSTGRKTTDLRSENLVAR